MSPSRTHDPCLQIPLTQHLLLRPRPMATATSPRDLKSPVTPMQPLIPVQLLTPMQPVTLMPLRPPEIDYLLLAIISFFCILLAILALVFSLKTREANFLGNQRKAWIHSRLILGFSMASILVGCIVIICSIVIKSLKQKI
uniref:Transmembrane protein n=2 Tax=Piliocolobus tephrosceles TaxID=591936 RepID=A0A8C9H6N8_9PRIM